MDQRCRVILRLVGLFALFNINGRVWTVRDELNLGECMMRLCDESRAQWLYRAYILTVHSGQCVFVKVGIHFYSIL